MKIKFLTIIAFCIFLSLVIFTAFVYSINLRLESDTDYGGGAVDLDSDLSPSYARDFPGMLLAFNSIFVAGPIMLGVISLIFIVSNIILRVKKIPTRKYMLIIAAGVLIFFGSPLILGGLQSVLILEQLEQENDWIILISSLVEISYGMAFIIPGIIALKKAKLRVRK